jgi:hypothetical protein
MFNRQLLYSILIVFVPLFVSTDPLLLTARRYNLVGVTRRKHRSRSWYFSQEAVTVQGGYGVVFAIRVQVLIKDTRVAVQVRSEPVNCHGTGCLLGALAQCRGTSLIGARKLSRYRIKIVGRCGCPGARFGRICHGSRVMQKP